MAKLSYRTRGNGNPQGKERVYFTCHPEDFESCFESVCEDVFKSQNCAIWYNSETDTPWDGETMEMELGRMQLFVIPVTSKFLYQDNEARNVEFAFAVEHHIPILPLMQESGLDGEFNRICGDLQFLDKNAVTNDPTAIPYDQKLEKFLSSVLLGDELAAKVRAAFDAYIFLSYRKKDRKYAQELMRLIHQNDFCRDIAIWYDEFLVPGENFNKAIGDAMEKSSLFAFVVTPNLLEKNNYVMTTEYPVAKKAGKPMLPAVMESTDLDGLKREFADIPEPTDAHDNSALSEALLEHIRKVAIETNDNDPNHLFFIGLAYLGGIDVEENRGRGVELITKAAKARVPEAMKKLAQMYNSGEGVERDYEKSAQWLEKLAAYWENRFNETKSQEDGDEFFDALRDAGNAWYDMHRLGHAKPLFEKLMSLSQDLYDRYGGLWNQRGILISEGMLALINYDMGNMPEARMWAEKSLTISEEHAKLERSEKSLRNLSTNYSRMGEVCQEEGALDEARSWYERGLEVDMELVKETGTMAPWSNLALAYQKLGDVSRTEGKLPEAKSWYAKSLEADEKMANETGLMGFRRGVLLNYQRMGKICQTEGNLAMARTYFKKCIDISEEFVAETGTVEARTVLANSYNDMGYICEDEGDLTDAKEYYRKSLDLKETLAADTDTTIERHGLFYSYTNMVCFCLNEDNLAEAKKYCQGAVEIAEELAKMSDTAETRSHLSLGYELMGLICNSEENLTGAREYYGNALKMREELASEEDTIEARRNLADDYDILWDVCKAEGDMAATKEYLQKYLELQEVLAGETGTAEDRTSLWYGYDDLGHILESEGNLTAARECYRKGLEIAESLVGNSENMEPRGYILASYRYLGQLCESEGDMNAAREYYLKSLESCESLYMESDEIEPKIDLAWTYEKLGYMDESHPNLDYLRRCEKICIELAQKYPQNPQYEDTVNLVRDKINRVENGT